MMEKIIMEKHPTKGPSEAEIQEQLRIFKAGIPFVHIVEAASLNNGIEEYSHSEQQEFVRFFESAKDQLDLVKFVPASGAATRMFRDLHQFLADFDPDVDAIDQFLEKEENSGLKIFFGSIENFAFYNQVIEGLKTKYPDYDSYGKGKRYWLFVCEMLDENGLDFGNTPKGLIPFHKYDTDYRTAFDEQLFEGAYYAKSNGIANLHFTVSEDHLEKFQQRFDAIADRIASETNAEFKVSYSFQKKETDTVAATLNNELFLDEEGNPVFRPSGHGALLGNLNDIDADVIFIKNIDNVVSKNHVDEIAFQKKVLAGRLVSLQQKIFNYIEELQQGNHPESLINEIAEFIKKELEIPLAKFSKETLLKILNRPLRVCGVVENTGEPGGGPFLIRNRSGNNFYQIVEMSQIDLNNPQQKELVDQATHFNPVDVVCGVRDYKGDKFDLMKYSDPNSGFISEKSHEGKPIKAMERPGLWNGAMAYWNTVFVEVPLITFNPVKEVIDLLDNAHQNP